MSLEGSTGHPTVILGPSRMRSSEYFSSHNDCMGACLLQHALGNSASPTEEQVEMATYGWY